MLAQLDRYFGLTELQTTLRTEIIAVLSTDDIAAITDETGRVLAMMPHPERGMFASQRDDYATLKDAARRAGKALPETADGMAIFKNAARYFESGKSRKMA